MYFVLVSFDLFIIDLYFQMLKILIPSKFDEIRHSTFISYLFIPYSAVNMLKYDVHFHNHKTG